jgi:hypothetical protein
MKMLKNLYHTFAANWHDAIFSSYADKTSTDAMDRFNKSISHSRKIK